MRILFREHKVDIITSLVSEIKVDAVLRESQVGLEGVLGGQGADPRGGEWPRPAPRSCARPVLRRGHGPGVAEVALAAGLRGPKQETVNTRGQHGGQHGAAGLGLGRAQHL